MNNKEDFWVGFVLFILGLLGIALVIILMVASYVMIIDTNANIKIKERIAENGIEITTKQVQELIEMEAENIE